MDIRHYNRELGNLREGVDLALKHRLYVSGWGLSGSLLEARHRPHRNAHLTLLFKDGVPITLGWYDGYMAMAFCKKTERRQGFASACIKAMNMGDYATAGEGLIGTGKFWKHCGIRDHYGYRW